MPLELKIYQRECLRRLEEFLRLAIQTGSSRDAFEQLTPRTYFRVDQLPDIPYVCLRVPTGGGKTILGAYAVPLIARALLHQDRSLVLWLAPTNTIVEQTIAALKNRSHPYRQALDSACGGNVSIFSSPEALFLPRPALDTDMVIIVSTLAALRVTDTEGRKFYEANGSLMPHFTGLTDVQRKMLADETDPTLICPSLANVIRLRRPIVIMDEAHNARTSLSFDTLQRFAPSCVLELTATPATEHNPRRGLFASNVLHHVSALELKEEAMIKLPIKVRCQPQWKTAVQESIARRKALEDLAVQEQAATGEYIRPIVLFQAEHEDAGGENNTPQVLKQALIDDFKIAPEQIAICTGKVDELGRTDVLSPDCPIRFIITVQKLKEGWDCPFAYVLCTVANVSARTAVEQILGRVLRLPRATKKLHDALNHAYVFVTRSDPHAAVLSLTELLEQNAGFSKFDASVSVVAEAMPLLGPLFDDQAVVILQATPDFTPAPIDLRAKVSFNGETKTLAWQDATPMNDAQLTVLQRCVTSEPDKKAVAELCQKSRGKVLAPAAQGESFSVPQLAVREDGKLNLFEDQFRDTQWSIATSDPALSESEYALPRNTMQTAVVDIAKETGHLQANFVTEIQSQLAFFDRPFNNTTEFVTWLAQKIYAPDLTHAEKSTFLLHLVKMLMDLRGYTLEQLVGTRFLLADSAGNKISQHRRAAMQESFQRYLLPDCATPLDVSAAVCFEFPMRSAYPAPSVYTGPIRFPKHYYQNVAQMNDEEAACAQHIDSHPKVKFWVRNLVRNDFAFWLPTSTDKFYPDFVAQLTDGRYLVVEYKGADRAPGESTDTDEKLAIGQLWEARSGRKCLFRLVTKADFENVLNSVV